MLLQFDFMSPLFIAIMHMFECHWFIILMQVCHHDRFYQMSYNLTSVWIQHWQTGSYNVEFEPGIKVTLKSHYSKCAITCVWHLTPGFICILLHPSSSLWEPLSHLMMLSTSGLICLSSETTAHWEHFCGLLNSSVFSCTLSPCAEHLTVSVWLMSRRSVHFHPHLPLVKKMIDCVPGPRWLTSPTHPPTPFLSLCQTLLTAAFRFPLSPLPINIWLSLTSFTAFHSDVSFFL